MKSLRVGIVGTGMAGRFHLECLRRVYGVAVEVVGVTSRRKESREAFGKAHGVRVFEDVGAMAREVDLIDVCSSPYAHEEGILAAVRAGKSVICEKPLSGYFGPKGAGEEYRGDTADKEAMLEEVVGRMGRLAGEVKKSGVFFGYAENFVYAPSVQKEREIIEKTGAQVVRMTGEESHNGSASAVYGIWRFGGGGSLIGKGCHPLTGMMYLKRVEGLARLGKAIRPKTVSARTHQLTRLPGYQDKKLLRTDYHDIEDYGFMHVEFEDGTVADVLTSEVVLGGIYDYIEVFANNHRTRCRISPTGLMETYNPRGEQYKDIYLLEKVSTQEGWSEAAPDENTTIGYQWEIQNFITAAANGGQAQSGLELALDTTTTIYAAYVSDQRKGAEVAIPLL